MREGWFYGMCEKHGKQPHLTTLNGECEVCAIERTSKEIEAKAKIDKYKRLTGNK